MLDMLFMCLSSFFLVIVTIQTPKETLIPSRFIVRGTQKIFVYFGAITTAFYISF